MIDRTHELPLARQAALLRLSRSSLYYEPQPIPEAELAIMRRIDALHLDYPFAGSRMLRDLLRGEGVVIGRERVRTGADADATDVHRGTVSPAEYVKALSGTHNLPVSAARPCGRAGEPGLVHGHHLHSHGTGLCLSRGGRGLVQPACSGLAGIDHHGGRFLPGGSGGGAGQVRVRSSPAPRSPACCGRTGSRSAWTVAARGGTMSLSSGYGER
jgi:hypothetical protein